MSIAQLKKQAKNLVRLLPGHIKAHPTGGSLAACQELIAKASGFPSFHAAGEEKSEERKNSKLLSQLIFEDLQDISQENALAQRNGWLGRSESFISAVLKLQVFLETRGDSLPSLTPSTSPYDLASLEAKSEKWRQTHPWLTEPLTQYLEALPGYEFLSARGSESIHRETLAQHDLIKCTIKSVQITQPHFVANVLKKIQSELGQQEPSKAVSGRSPRSTLSLDSFHLPFRLKACLFPPDGIVLIAGVPGTGKSTFKDSIAEALLNFNQISDGVMISGQNLTGDDPKEVAQISHALSFFDESTATTVDFRKKTVYAELTSISTVQTVLDVLTQIPLPERIAAGRTFLTSLRLVIWLRLGPPKDGKRLTIFEFLPFRDSLIQKLLGIDPTNTEAVRQALDTALSRDGQGIAVSASELFAQGLIDEPTRDKLIFPS